MDEISQHKFDVVSQIDSMIIRTKPKNILNQSKNIVSLMIKKKFLTIVKEKIKTKILNIIDEIDKKLK